MRMIFGMALCLAFADSTDAVALGVNCADPQSNLEMKICTSQSLAKAESELSVAFEQALKGAQSQYDSVRDELGSERMPNMPEELRKVERSWEIFRDANCGYQTLVYYGGSMAPLAVLGCRLDMTKARIKELKDLVESK